MSEHRGSRLRKWLVDRGWAHAVLFSGSAIFLLPFLWMVATSMKTDEELSDAAWLPSIPSFAAASPYVRVAREPHRPSDAPEAVWREAIVRMDASARAAVLLGIPADAGVDRDALAAAAAAVLVDQLAAKMPRTAWSTSADAGSAFTGLLTPEAVASAIDDRLARLELKNLQLRTLDGHVIPLATEQDLVAAASVESGAGILAAAGGATRLSYHFASSSDAPVVVRIPLTLPADFDPASLHKLILGLKSDDSWHRLDATLDLGGTHWTSTRTTWLAKHRPLSVLFQPPTFDDQTSRPRTWVPLAADNPEIRTSSESQRPMLRLIIRPSSTIAAISGKAALNYQRSFRSVPFWTYCWNSVLLVTLTMGGALFSSAFVGYAFARLRWPGRSIALIVLLSTMMLPSQVTMIPSFLIWRELGWYNTLNPLWVPAWFGNAFFIFLMVQQMKALPRELEEAARIDGMNAVQTWWYVIVPQVKPTLAGIAIMSFMGAWNEFMGPLIYLRDQSKFPLSLGLFGINLEHGGDWTMIMAGNILLTLPVILIFFCFQRYFIQGMTVTGMKG